MRAKSPRQWFILVLLLVAATYLAAHALYGRHGLAARGHLAPRAALLQSEIQRQEEVRRRLLRDVALLSDPKPDSDLVGEIARSMLSFADPREIVVMRPAPSR
jgi:cell division protein FtsB